jgi:hypothetical protein
MRFKQIRPLTEEQLDELRMSPSTLNKFSVSDEAKGIMAGFEAELVFTGLGGEAEYDEDPEPDYDVDERCNSVQQVVEFFENDEYGYGTSGRDLSNLQEGLDEKYMEWHDDQMYSAFRDEAEDLIKKIIEEDDFDWDDETRKQLDMMELSNSEIEEAMKQGKEAPKFNRSSEQEEYALSNPGYQRYLEAYEQAEGLLDDLVQDSLTSQDKNYDSALDEFRDDFYVDDDSSFFGDVGLRWMSDVASEFSLMWPVMTYTGQSSEGGFSEENAQNLAKDLSEKLGVKTKVSSGYHSAKRDDVTWIFEPDSSLDADDSDNMPVEIVSPPMPLLDCLRQMENFFTWAEDNGAYANSSTGFHMGVSLPHRGGAVDYVKLALFLGDEHVLKEFGRSSNHFCAAAIKKIRDRIKGNKEAIGNAMELMRNNLIELAQKSLEINNHGFGKYTSINPQGGNDSTHPDKERGAKYIEFRSAGGTNYFEDIDKLKNTLLRYSQAMAIAGNPAAERKEYYKKLYKLISPPEGDVSLDLFSRFASGEISSEDLKKQWADKQLEKEPKGDWKVYDTNGKYIIGQDYHGFTKSEVWDRAKQKLSPGSSMEGFQKAYRVLPMQSQTGDWEVYNNDTGETLEILRGYPNKGAAADAVYDKYVTDQGIPFNLRPADPDAPEKPLTKRERLAKNIKAQGPAPTVYYKWNIANPKTGENTNDYMTRERVFQTTKKVEKENPKAGKYTNSIVGKGSAQLNTAQELRDIEEMSFDFRVKGSSEVIEHHTYNRKTHNVDGYDCPVVVAIERASELSNELGKTIVAYEAPAKADKQKQDWDVIYKPTGRVIDTIQRVDKEKAQKLLGHVAVLHDFSSADDLEIRTQELTKAADNTESADWEFYRTETGNVIDSISNASEMQANAVRADIVRRYGHPDASVGMRRVDQVQDVEPDVAQNFTEPAQPTQRTDNAGVPMWEIFDRQSGNAIHTFATQEQVNAWQIAQEWLQGIGAEQPNLFSCRPAMTTVSEARLNSKWESVVDSMVGKLGRLI